jgi:hypothetical protein
LQDVSSTDSPSTSGSLHPATYPHTLFHPTARVKRPKGKQGSIFPIKPLVESPLWRTAASSPRAAVSGGQGCRTTGRPPHRLVQRPDEDGALS